MQTQELIKVEQDLWESAAERYREALAWPVVVPNDGCDCMGCNVARLYLLPFLPVTWH